LESLLGYYSPIWMWAFLVRFQQPASIPLSTFKSKEGKLNVVIRLKPERSLALYCMELV
jgi:hypothetical protein